MKKKIVFGYVLLSATSVFAQIYPEKMPIQDVLNNFMEKQYGKINSEKRCHEITDSKTKANFCMQLQSKKAQLVDNTLYFSVASVDGALSDLDSGIVDLFIFERTADGWKQRAAGKNLSCGTHGNCTPQDVVFQKLGTDYYGWMIASGTMDSGGGTQMVELVAEKNKKVVSLGTFFTHTEKYPGKEFALKVTPEQNQKYYSITLYKRTDSGKPLGKELMPFDEKKWQYNSPFNFTKR